MSMSFRRVGRIFATLFLLNAIAHGSSALDERTARQILEDPRSTDACRDQLARALSEGGGEVSRQPAR